MSVPGIVQSRLDGEQVAATVSLGGEDALFVTPTRTLIYRGDGLLSDESVEEYPHDAERIALSEGRRKSAIELDYGIDGTQKFKVPSDRLYEALHPVLAGVLNAADVTGTEETVKQTYQFSELTLVITSDRVVKHVGAAVWDEDYEEYPFADVTALDVEEGSVSSQIIIESEGRPQRIKTPSDQTREVRERIERALLDYYGANSYEEFASQHAASETEDESMAEERNESAETADPLAGGVDPIEANPPELNDDGAIIDSEASVTADETAAPNAADGQADGGPDSQAGGRTGPDAESTSADASAPVTESSERDGSPERTEVASSRDADRASDASETGQETSTDRSADSGTATETTAVVETETGSGFADSGFEPASSELQADATDEQLKALTEAVERQNELLAEHQRTLETLVEELNRR